MGKECLWKKASKVRKIIKDRRTTITKSRNGNTVGGIALDDDTIKPYMKQLADIEAQLKKDKDAMSTKERVDDAAKEVMADAAQNKEDITTTIQDCFAKAFPKKFAKIHKWAYVRPSSGSAGEAPKIKVRVDEYMDRELDLYKYYDADGNAGSAAGSALEWITHVGQTVTLTPEEGKLPKNISRWSEGVVLSEPPATKPESPNDMFELKFPGNTRRKVRREFLVFRDEECKCENHDMILGTDEFKRENCDMTTGAETDSKSVRTDAVSSPLEREQAYGLIMRMLTTSSSGTPLNLGPGDCSEDDPIEAEDCGEDEKRENASLAIGVPDPPPPAMPEAARCEIETSPKPKEKKENTENTEKKEKKEKEEKKEKTEKKKKKTETIVSWSPKANDATKGKLGSWVEAVVRILKTNRKDNMIERAFCSLNKDMDKQQFYYRVTWDGECASIGEGLCTVRHAPVDGLPSMIQWVR